MIIIIWIHILSKYDTIYQDHIPNRHAVLPIPNWTNFNTHFFTKILSFQFYVTPGTLKYLFSTNILISMNIHTHKFTHAEKIILQS